MKASSILAFGASYSRESINSQFAVFVASHIPTDQLIVVRLEEFDIPLYTPHYEKEFGIPSKVNEFDKLIQVAELIVISLAEHNGSYTAAFKNLFDWLTRLRPQCFEGKKLILTATAPGPRGGLGVLEAAEERFPRHGAEIIGTFSLPHFNENFDKEKGITQPDLKIKFDEWMTEQLRKLN
jgi:NAD(P)H-dependent FMN reductase